MDAFLADAGLTCGQVTLALRSLDARRAIQSRDAFATTLSSDTDDGERWTELALSPTPDGWALTLTDCTEAVEEDLAHAPAAPQPEPLALDGLMQGLSTGMVLLPAEGPFGRINAAACELLGVETLAQARRQLTLLAGDVFAAPVTRIALREDQDGAERTLALSASPVDLGGAAASLITVTDLTGVLDLPQTAEGHVATINHEMRTPLASLIGSLDILARDIADGQDARSSRLVDMSRRNAGRLLALVEDLMAAHEADHDALSVKVQPVDPAAALSEAVEANTGFAARHGVRLSLDGEHDGAKVMADPRRLQQVLSNLISNAVKYSGGAQVVHLDLRREAGAVSIEVRDRGLGIPAQDLPHIFGRFYRVGGDDHRRVRGTGLGLAISQDLVARMGGEITVTSSTGRHHGTTFRVRLPLAEAASATG